MLRAIRKRLLPAIAALAGAILSAAPAHSALSVFWSFRQEFPATDRLGAPFPGYGSLIAGRIDNIRSDGDLSQAYLTVTEDYYSELLGGPYFSNNANPQDHFTFDSNGNVTDAFVSFDHYPYYVNLGYGPSVANISGASIYDATVAQFSDTQATFSQVFVSGPYSGPEAPAPMIGSGIAPAIAAFGSLAFARFRRRQLALA